MSRHKSNLRVFKPKERLLPKGIHILKIEGLTDDGRGIAKSEAGKAIFVEGALPSETIKVKYINSHKQYDEAEMVEVLDASEFRVPPVCQHFEQCGGCNLQHVSYRQQVRIKQNQLERLFTYHEKTQGNAINWLPAITAQPEHYRHRVRFAISTNKKGLQLGFKQGGSHQVTDVKSCAISDTLINELLPHLKPQLNFLQKRSLLQECIVSLDSKNQMAVQLLCKSELPSDDNEKLNAFAQHHKVFLRTNLTTQVYGEPLFETGKVELEYALPNQIQIYYEVTDFTQVNMAINHTMIETAIDWLELSGQDTVADYFCGVGNLTLSVAKHVMQSIGFELVKGMVLKAKANAERCNIDNVEFKQADLFKHSGKHFSAANKLILDPPRAGAQQLCEALANSSADKILYISCNPSTLARDVGVLQQSGYEIEKACLIDMFPHTKHMEAMMLLKGPIISH
ncbi:MAG: 23S rRNA (uracil1939-C5)-methyltransferase [Pseudohongiellaceae bacterium]|jgi:23S rRNA (uracil1939-C5)-methyltransferase